MKVKLSLCVAFDEPLGTAKEIEDGDVWTLAGRRGF